MDIESLSLDNNSPKDLPIIGRWLLLEELGAGATSKVFLANDRFSSQQVAIKIFTAASELSQQLALIESNLLKDVYHSNIVSLVEHYDSIVLQDPFIKKKIDVSAIAMEYVPCGNLADLLKRTKYLSEEQSRVVFKQLIDAIGYLHGKSISHGDLKPDNILLADKQNIKLADFAFSSKFKPNELFKLSLGTPKYWSPEIINGKPYSPEAADLFAAGIILFEMATGHMPFILAHKDDDFYGLLCRKDFDLFWDCHTKTMGATSFGLQFSKHFKDIIQRMLSSDPKNRMSLNDIKNHPWIR